MSRSFWIILLLIPTAIFAQDIPEEPSAALDQYIKMREGYKRSHTKQFSKTEQMEMDDYCFAMQEKFPDAYETDFMWYLNGHFYQERGDKLKAAYRKAPSDKRVVKAMFGYYMMTDKKALANGLSSVVSKYYSANTLAYYEDVLPSKGIIIVSSEAEAIPIYVLQLAKGKGSMVHVINMDYLINDGYRAGIAHFFGTGNMEFFGNEASYIEKAMKANGVYVSSTVPQAYIPGSSYLTGLYYQAKVSDQKKTLETFWTKMSKKNFASMSLTSAERRLYRNYLPPLLTLYKLKKHEGETAETLKVAIKAIAKKVQQTETVDNILKAYDSQ
jgi:hypothetical protein